ncbi:MAG: cytochrome c family protein [Bacteroidota bacterium]
MLSKKLLSLAVLALFAVTSLMAQDFKYIGAAKCKMCHMKPATGDQYNMWLKGPHANAMKTLATDEAKKIATEKGIADPTTDAACVKCHATVGHIDKGLVAGIVMSEGVSCESCHGPGSMYKSASIMKNRDLALQKGMIMPTEEVCKTCHNAGSPTYKAFNYAEFSAKIAHPDPTLH